MKAEYRHKTAKQGRTLKVVFWTDYFLVNTNQNVQISHAFLKKLLKKAGCKKVVRK